MQCHQVSIIIADTHIAMPTDNHEKEIFNAALEQPTEQRATFLRDACQGDGELLRRVEELLQAYDGSSKILADNATTVRQGTPLTETSGTIIGRYKLLQKIGEGGMGVVYMAEQTEPLTRKVALKIIKLGMDTRQVVARFEAERQALALMDHPNIAKVLDAGATDTGRPYFVMELVRGVPITEYCDKNHLPTKPRLDLFMQVCHAVQSAHQKGIIHRDLKPSNILVTLNDGVPLPMVIDFGIAKATNQKLTEKTLFTNYASMIGTPAYMSPEQAEMSKLDVDTRTDIYALGVLLYELLTGTTPFPAKELLSMGYGEMQRVIAEREPIRPSTRLSTMVNEERTVVAKNRSLEASALGKLFSGDLDWIVMKCLEKDRTRRYETANGLAMDVKRHLSNEPVIARPPSAAYKLQKAWQRNKLAFTAGAAVAAALVVGSGVSTWQAIRATEAKREQSRLRQLAEIEQRKALEARASEAKQRQAAEEARQNEALLRQQAQANELIARRAAFNSDMNVAQQALQLNNTGRASEILNRHRPKPGESDLRGWEWRYLWRFCQSDALFTLCRQSNSIFSVAFSPDGRFLAVADESSEVAVWDLAARKRVMSRRTHLGHQRIAFSPVGSQLAFGEKGPDGRSTVKLWDADKGQDVLQWLIPGDARELVFAKDGSSLAAWSTSGKGPEDDSRIFLWHISSGRKLFETAAKRAATGGGNMLALSDRSEILAYGSVGGEIVLIDVPAGREKSRLHVTEETTMAVTILNGGKALASASGHTDPVVKLWDLDTGKEAGHLEGHRSYVHALAASPDGRLLASASGDQTIRIWDWEERRLIMTLRGHLSEVLAVAFAPDGQALVSGCKDGTVSMWNIASNRNEQPYDFLPVRVCLKNREKMQSILEAGKKQRVSEENGENDLT
ncbi:MAG: protein kinase [Verrucomicrobia bacterium]|nr:protein kinase [Verrucomicrobiota bacterium]